MSSCHGGKISNLKMALQICPVHDWTQEENVSLYFSSIV